MLGSFGGLSTLTIGVEAIAVIVVLILFANKPLLDLSRSRAVFFGASWVLIITAEYWILGPFSFVHINDEGENVIPLYSYLATIHDGGRLARGVAGDTDAYAMLAGGMTLFSPGILLLKLFPVWVVIGFHKIAVSGAAVAGAYILARRAGGADRCLAIAAALTYSVAHRYLTSGTLTMGFLSYAIIPLAVYVFVFRLEKTNYLRDVFILSLLLAISISPTHTGLSLGTTIILAWLFLVRRKFVRLLSGISLLLLSVIVVWHEKMFAFVQMAPQSYRGTIADFSVDMKGFLGLIGKYFHSRSPEGLILLIVAVSVLWITNRAVVGRLVAMLVLSLLVGPLLLLIPWQNTPFSWLRGFDFYYATYSFPVLLVIAVSYIRDMDTLTFGWRPLSRLFPVGIFLAIAIGQATWLKAFHAAQWVGMGGQTIYQTYANLIIKDWAPDHLFRSVTIPYRMDPNTISAYGLESFDGFGNVRFANKVRFWDKALTKSNRAIGTGYLYVTSHDEMDFLCCEAYDADSLLNLNALKVGNVEFVISVLPLTSSRLQMVSGPASGFVPPRRDASIFEKVGGFLKLLFVSENAYVYRITNSLPRAYVATEIEIVDHEPATSADYELIVDKALEKYAIMPLPSFIDLDLASTLLGDGTVLSIRPIFEGYELNVDMSSEGLVIVNTPWSPHWRAMVDGTTIQNVSVNGIHTAIKVGSGTHKVTLKYQRPYLKDVLVEKFPLFAR